MAYSHGRVMPSEKWMLAFTCSNSALDSLTGRTKQQFWRTLRLTRIEQKPALPLKQQCLSLNRRWKALPSSWHTPVQHPMILLLVQFPWKCTNPPPAPPSTFLATSASDLSLLSDIPQSTSVVPVLRPPQQGLDGKGRASDPADLQFLVVWPWWQAGWGRTTGSPLWLRWDGHWGSSRSDLVTETCCQYTELWSQHVNTQRHSHKADHRWSTLRKQHIRPGHKNITLWIHSDTVTGYKYTETQSQSVNTQRHSHNADHR